MVAGELEASNVAISVMVPKKPARPVSRVEVEGQFMGTFSLRVIGGSVQRGGACRAGYPTFGGVHIGGLLSDPSSSRVQLQHYVGGLGH